MFPPSQVSPSPFLPPVVPLHLPSLYTGPLPPSHCVPGSLYKVSTFFRLPPSLFPSSLPLSLRFLPPPSLPPFISHLTLLRTHTEHAHTHNLSPLHKVLICCIRGSSVTPGPHLKMNRGQQVSQTLHLSSSKIFAL